MSDTPVESDDSDDHKHVVVGVCAMEKKSRSKPMKEIISRISDWNELITVLIFTEAQIAKPVEEWPHCDCLICFHSKGFPLQKAVEYVKLHQPYVLNDLERQFDLLDRRRVYEILKRSGVPAPHYQILVRDPEKPGSENLIESDDHIEVNGVVFAKPFVEKPISAENHNICIYYPSAAGGGSQRLFRKVNNLSSVYSSEHSSVRRDASYIYENFMPTDGTDVKVYAVGPDYAHAEARKSPGLDGKVERDADGKEIRYPVILSSTEKLIARKIVLAFRQTVCGFDLLRSNGTSYVCDVNGFSFVKNSVKYYEDTARIIGNNIMRRLAPTLHIPWAPAYQLDDPPLVSTTYGKMMELRAVIAVIRHGDRTPKQKMKMEVWHKLFFDLYYKYGGAKSHNAELKLKRPNQLQEVLDIARQLLKDIRSALGDNKPVEIRENRAKLEQLKTVLEMYGYFSGINRKVQMRYQQPQKKSSASNLNGDGIMMASPPPSLLVVLKWGGELTPAGRIQAEELAKAFRCLYPGGQGQYGQDSRGLGFLRLHSTYRHDLKIYASDEGRVQMTAAAFAKGLLALEGELTPVLVQMVKSANTNGLLDDDKDAKFYQNQVKQFLHQYLQQNKDFSPEDLQRLNPLNSRSISNALAFVGNPWKMCHRIYDMMLRLGDLIKMRKSDPAVADRDLYLSESWDLAERRWMKLIKDFKQMRRFEDSDSWNISKIPDIYDSVKYDLEHNSRLLNFVEMEELYVCSKYMADIVVPQEYGMTKQEKLLISQGICTPLLTKIKSDLEMCIKCEPEDENLTRLDPRASKGIATPLRHVRTRLYFTSESHIHSLVNMIVHGELVKTSEGVEGSDKQWSRAMSFLSSVTEFNYMAQLVIMLYEDTTKSLDSPDRFHIELHFSPGALPCIQTTHVPGLGYRPKSRETDSIINSTATVTNGDADESDGSKINCSVGNPPEILPKTVKLGKSSVNVVAVGNNHLPIRAIDMTSRWHFYGNSNVATVPNTSANEDLAANSPAGSPRGDSPLLHEINLPSGCHSIMKSSSESAFRYPPVEIPNEMFSANNAVAVVDGDELKSNNYNSNVMAVTEQITMKRTRHSFDAIVKCPSLGMNLGFLRRTVRDNKLISTEVINGMMSVKEEKTFPADPALMSTAVIARGNSAPDLKTLSEESYKQELMADDDVSYFVPPLRSLETLHNQLNYKQVDDFLGRIITLKTPVPSPQEFLSRENSTSTNVSY